MVATCARRTSLRAQLVVYHSVALSALLAGGGGAGHPTREMGAEHCAGRRLHGRAYQAGGLCVPRRRAGGGLIFARRNVGFALPRLAMPAGGFAIPPPLAGDLLHQPYHRRVADFACKFRAFVVN